MKSHVFLLCVSLVSGSTVRREAEAEADPYGYLSHGGYLSDPHCTYTPVKECKPRTVETPKKVCQTVVDKHQDTVVTEDCEETVTTVCTQTSTTSHHTSSVVDTSTELVEEGEPRPITEISHQHKREAEAAADPVYTHFHSTHVSVPVRNVSPPDCSSTPVKTCNKTPKTRPRIVSRVVCETVVDVTHIEDCTETITKSCSSSSTSHARHSTVTGHDTKVIGSGL